MAPRGRLSRYGALAFSGIAWASSDVALADVATDGTLGRRVRLTGPDVEVGADLGRVRDKNLFHSFERFDVPSRGRVTFTGPAGLDNVVSRVTGGEPSSIDGTLASRMPGADVYIVNPSGIVFGPNARLDVPGSFHASTADELRFSDGVAFSASNPNLGGLSVARPEAFGFLGRDGAPGAITLDRARLAVPPGEALSLVGGDVTVTGGGFAKAQAGRVSIVGLGGTGTADVATGWVMGDASAAIHFSRGGVVVSGDGGGEILIRGGALTLDDVSLLLASNSGSLQGGSGIDIRVDVLTVTRNSGINASSEAEGSAPPVRIRATELVLVSDISYFNSSAFASGDAGSITIQAGELIVRDNALIGTDTSTSGDAGAVTIRAETVRLRNSAKISSTTLAFGDTGVTGDAGAVTI